MQTKVCICVHITVCIIFAIEQLPGNGTILKHACNVHSIV